MRKSLITPISKPNKGSIKRDEAKKTFLKKLSSTIGDYNRDPDYSSCKSQYSYSYSDEIPSSSYEQWLPLQAPNSVDLREWGLTNIGLDQGSCGSCWAFTTRTIMTSLFIRDLPYYKQIYSNNSYIQNLTGSTAKLSVQQILNNSYGSNKMCGGGNFFVAAVELGNGFAGSMDFESQIPYMSSMQASEAPATSPVFINAKTTEFAATPLNPIHLHEVYAGQCPSIYFQLNLDDST